MRTAFGIVFAVMGVVLTGLAYTARQQGAKNAGLGAFRGFVSIALGTFFLLAGANDSPPPAASSTSRMQIC